MNASKSSLTCSKDLEFAFSAERIRNSPTMNVGEFAQYTYNIKYQWREVVVVDFAMRFDDFSFKVEESPVSISFAC